MTVLLVAVAAAAIAEDALTWEDLQRDNAVIVQTATAPDGSVFVRGVSSLAVARDDLVAVLLDLPNFPALFRSLSTWRVLQRSDSEAIVYGRHRLPWPFSDRDYTVRYTWYTEPDGTFVLDSRSIDAPGPAPQAGVVRLSAVRSTWRVVPAGAQTTVSYSYNGDLGGRFPEFLRRTAWKTEVVDLFSNLRGAVARRSGGGTN